MKNMLHTESKAQKELNIIGSFRVESGKLRVTDPCYSKDTWCSGVLKNVMNGDWFATIVKKDEDTWGIRVAELHVYHADHIQDMNYSVPKIEERTDIHVGVDSGQAGFFDEDKYPEHVTVEHDTFYNVACSLTLSENQAGILYNGVVSSSGFGDGGYECFVSRLGDGKIIAAKIVFIGEEDDE